MIDATCPLVTKVHLQAQRYRAEQREVILIGHPGHPEVEGTRGRIDGRVHVLSTVEEVERLDVDDPERLAYVTQTTLSIDDTREVIEALERRFPAIDGPELKDICYATQNRQNAVQASSPEEIDLPARGRLAEQLELQPPARARRAQRRARAPDRRRRARSTRAGSGRRCASA